MILCKCLPSDGFGLLRFLKDSNDSVFNVGIAKIALTSLPFHSIHITNWTFESHLECVGRWVRIGRHVDLDLLLVVKQYYICSWILVNKFYAIQRFLLSGWQKWLKRQNKYKQSHSLSFTWLETKELGEAVIGESSFCFSWKLSKLFQSPLLLKITVGWMMKFSFTCARVPCWIIVVIWIPSFSSSWR